MRTLPRLFAFALAAVLALPAIAAEQGAASSAELYDMNRNGRMDRVMLSVGNPDRNTWSVHGHEGLTVLYNGSAVTKTAVGIHGSANADPLHIVVDLAESDLPADTGAENFALTYEAQGVGNGIDDGNTELAAFDAENAPELMDMAPPLLVSTTPAPGAKNVTRAADVKLTFSERMDTSSFAFTSAGDSGGWSTTWDAAGRVATLTHSLFRAPVQITFTVEAAKDLSGNALAPALRPHAFSFRTTTDNSPGPVDPDPVFELLAPQAGDAFPERGATIVAWYTNLANNGVATVRLRMSADGGASWQTALTASPDEITSVWSVPAGLEGSLRLHLEGLNAQGAVYAIDDAFSVTVLPPEEVPSGDDTPPIFTAQPSVSDFNPLEGTALLTWTTDEPTTAEVAYGAELNYGNRKFVDALRTHHTAMLGGLTPGLMHQARVTAIDAGDNVAVSKDVFFVFLNEGELITTVNSAAVYWYLDGKRYVFPNETVFRTWFSGFDDVVEVPASQLARIPIGGNVKMRSGAWLIKIQSDPKTYAVEPDGTLRWVQTEARAEALYGPDWNQHIRDVDVSLFVDYVIGEPLGTDAFPASYVAVDADGALWLVEGGLKHRLSDNAADANRYDPSMAAAVDASSSAWTGLGIGTQITGFDERMSVVDVRPDGSRVLAK